MQMYCIGYNDDLIMQLPLQVLPPLAADFDGDSLNVLMIINRKFYERCCEIFNPRNAMYISRNDGLSNSAVLVQRDTIINANTLVYLGRKNYTKEQMDKIKAIKERQKEIYGL